MAGKAPVFLANGNLYDDTAEVIQLTYGKNVKISGYWGQITEKDSVMNMQGVTEILRKTKAVLQKIVCALVYL